MKYVYAEDLQRTAEEISKILFPHVKLHRIKCFRSYGTSSRGTITRCHAIGKIIQKALEIEPFYTLEFLAERFDKMSEEEKIKVIIHELMHIPNSFGGGFRHHDYVCDKNIDMNYRAYKNHKNSVERSSSLLPSFLSMNNENKKSFFSI